MSDVSTQRLVLRSSPLINGTLLKQHWTRDSLNERIKETEKREQMRERERQRVKDRKRE